MLVYSTLLDIRPSLTKEKFIDLVIRWNKGSPHRDLIIQRLDWNGEKKVRYGHEGLWIDIEEYGDIIAVRLEQAGRDGSLRDTDFVLNSADRKLAVQMDQSCCEGAQFYDMGYSPPYFISMLIDEGHLEMDDGLPVLYKPEFIRQEDLRHALRVINCRSLCRLPVVYVSKTICNTDPLNVWELAKKLRGAAHVLVQENRNTNPMLREATGCWNEYNGAVGIYFPRPLYEHKRFLHRGYRGREKALLEKIVRSVMQFSNTQNPGKLYTWQGVSNLVLLERLAANRQERIRAEAAREEAENEKTELYDALDEELKELQNRVEELTRRNDALTAENNGLRMKLSSADTVPLLIYGNEEDFYEGEIKDIILSALIEYQPSCPERSRRADVLADIIQCNGYMALGKKKEETLKAALRGYRTLTGGTKQALEAVGLLNLDNNKHSKFLYYGVERYAVTLAKTPSDFRTGMNITKEISALLF